MPSLAARALTNATQPPGLRRAAVDLNRSKSGAACLVRIGNNEGALYLQEIDRFIEVGHDVLE
jgi:hypothetical protein